MRRRLPEQALQGFIGERVTGRSAVLIRAFDKLWSKKNRSRGTSVFLTKALSDASALPPNWFS
jgi:hypothetical protein